MASYVTPKINTEYILYISVVSQADTKLMQGSATIAAGDFQVSTNGGALGNLATLPVVTPAASAMIKVTLSAGEMNGDNVTLVCKDAAGAEWCDLTVNIQTSTRQIDDLAFPVSTGVGIDVEAGGGVGLDLGNVTGTLTNANLAFVDVNERVDLGSWLGTAVTLSTGLKPDVNVNEWADVLLATTNPLPNAVPGATGGVFIAGTNAATVVTTSFTTAFTGSLTGSVASVTGAVGSVTGAVGSVTGDTKQTGDNFAVVNGAAGLVAIDTVVDAIKAVTDLLPNAGALTDITGSLPSALITGNADSGTTTTIVDTELNQADDDWFVGQWVRFNTTTLLGQTALITAFSQVSNTLTFVPAVTTAVVTHGYEIIPANAVAIDWGQVLNPTTVVDLAGTDINLVDTLTTYTGNTLQTADVASLNDISSANVLTQVNAALDTAIAELGVAAPTATPTLRTAAMLGYMALRNQTIVQTSGVDALEIYNNAGTKIAAKALTDDGSDYTEAQMA